MVLTLSYLTVDGAEPLEHIEAAAAAGLDGADIRILAPTHLPIRRRVVGNRGLVQEMLRVCERTGTRIVNVESIALRPGVKVESFLPALETAAELGATNALTLIEDLGPAAAEDRFGELAQLARPFGLRLALEFMPMRAINSLGEAMTLIESVGYDAAGLLIDALHLHWTGGSVADVAMLPPEAIAFVQICDVSGPLPPPEQQLEVARQGRLYPGLGDLPLAELIDALPDGVPLSIETPYRAHAKRSVTERARLAGAAARHFLAELKTRREAPIAAA
jgi:sugar phosphate isomerase/epimerase